MGKHRAPRKPDVPMRFAVASTAALLTAVVSAELSGQLGGVKPPNRSDIGSALSSGPFTAPPVDLPEAAAPPPNYEPHQVDSDPGRDTYVPAPTWHSDPAPEADTPEIPVTRDVVGGAKAAWVSGTMQGYDLLAHIERVVAEHMKARLDPPAV